MKKFLLLLLVFVLIKGSYAENKSTIILDSGHGGIDTGLIQSDIKEKDLTLNIAKKIKDVILENTKFKVFSTRLGDYNVSYEDRSTFANFNKGDVFLSFHINNSSNSCIEIYYFMPIIETNTNSEIIKNWDAVQNEYINKSKNLALLIQEQLEKYGLICKVGKCPSILLKSINMPAILIEFGFDIDKDQISESIYKGILEYIK
ncbi:MAG: N-acetylmuramoyl-L-alanine amidase [bacterium]